MLACDVCGRVHYAMTANEKAQSDRAFERYNTERVGAVRLRIVVPPMPQV